MMRKTIKKISLIPIICSLSFVLTACKDDVPVDTNTATPDNLNIATPNVTSGIGGGTGGGGGGGGTTNTSSVKRGDTVVIQGTIFAGVDESSTYESMKYLQEQNADGFNKLKNSGKIFELNQGTAVSVLAIYGDIAEVKVAATRMDCFVPVEALTPAKENNTENKEEQKQ